MHAGAPERFQHDLLVFRWLCRAVLPGWSSLLDELEWLKGVFPVVATAKQRLLKWLPIRICYGCWLLHIVNNAISILALGVDVPLRGYAFSA